ncbi:hypothetical protein Plhal703r1_c17g0078671 [Plasmopara halstedii]
MRYLSEFTLNTFTPSDSKDPFPNQTAKKLQFSADKSTAVSSPSPTS